MKLRSGLRGLFDMYDSIIIFGATATGKTSIAIKVAQMLNTEIINADSMYIYHDLNIGTAKPTKQEMNGIKHHLIDIAQVNDNFNVSNFRAHSIPIINDFKHRELIPIVVGGTGLYINSLITNYSYGNNSHSDELRKQLTNELNLYGKEYLYNKLFKLDPIIAQTLHVNDVSRVIRAIEIKTLSGISKANIVNNHSPLLKNPLLIGLTMPREILYEKINKRVDIMIANGLIDEVKSIYSRGLNPDNCQSLKGIGYKEIIDYFDGKYTLDDAIEKIKQHTRNYAKRQITWFKRYNNVNWFDTNNDHNIENKIIQLFNKKDTTF